MGKVVDINALRPHRIVRGACSRCFHTHVFIQPLPRDGSEPEDPTECDGCGEDAIVPLDELAYAAFRAMAQELELARETLEHAERQVRGSHRGTRLSPKFELGMRSLRPWVRLVR